MDSKLTVSSSPHIFFSDTVSGIMFDVIIALFPCCIAGVVVFGIKALLMLAVCVASCVLAEHLWCKIIKKPTTVSDFSAIVTGILLALSVPSSLPLWMAVIGCVIAIIVVKQFFGGIGHNFVNPAVCARVVLLVSFPAQMTKFYEPFSSIVSSATPLVSGKTPLKVLLLGGHSGCIGEGFPLLILLGGIYLLVRRVISPAIPLSFMASSFVMTLILTGSYYEALYGLLSGGIVIAAVFMATDYTTSPKPFWGKIVFGVGCGVLTVIIRQFGSMPEGVSYALIIMNILVPHINRIFAPKPFGYKEGKKNA